MEAANTEAATQKSRTLRDNPCKVEGCKRKYRAKGYCNVHYKKWRRGELEAKPRYKTCCEENCNKPLYKKGYCEAHYSAWSASRKGSPATTATADREVKEAAPAEAPASPAEEKPAEAAPAEAPAEEKPASAEGGHASGGEAPAEAKPEETTEK